MTTPEPIFMELTEPLLHVKEIVFCTCKVYDDSPNNTCKCGISHSYLSENLPQRNTSLNTVNQVIFLPNEKLFGDFKKSSSKYALTANLSMVVLQVNPEEIFSVYIFILKKDLEKKEKAKISQAVEAIFSHIDANYIRKKLHAKIIYRKNNAEKEYQRQLNSTHKAYKNLQNSIISNIKREIEENYKIKLQISDKAIDKIRDSGHSYDLVKKMLIDAFNSLRYSINKDTVAIEASDITIKNEELVIKTGSKGMDLLNGLEAAAQQLQYSNVKVNGKSIAQLINRTPSAILDSISRNKKEIEKLLEADAERWPRIRKGILKLKKMDDNILKERENKE